MTDEKRPKLTEELDLPPGVVMTPGYEVPEPPAPGPQFADRRIFVHEDAMARAKEQTRFMTAEVADHPILSKYEGPQSGTSEADHGAAARDHARRSQAANKE